MDESRKNFVNNICPEITKMYNEAYQIFCLDRNSGITSFEVISEFITDNCPPRQEIYIKKIKLFYKGKKQKKLYLQHWELVI